jgi:PAS domain S-box-containing protein
MSDKPISVLLIEDNPGDARLIREMLKEVGAARFELAHAERLDEGLKRLAEEAVDVVLLDLNLPDGQGLDTFARAYRQAPDLPIIVLTGLDDETLALQAVKAGAQDYLVKGQVDSSPLVRALHYAIERKRMEKEMGNLAKFPAEDPAPVLRLARDGTILYANPSSRPLLQLWGCEVNQRLTGDWRELILEPLTTGLGKKIELECGDTIYSLTLAPIVDAGYVNIYGTDVTESKRAEEMLRESEARYRALVEQIPAVTYIAALDEPGTTLYFSPQIETILGFPQDEWLAERDLFHRQLHPDDRERVPAELARSRASGEPFKSEYRLLARDGSVVWFRDEAVMVRDEAGNPLFLQGVMFDITGHKLAEEALRESEERYRTLVENMPIGVYRNTPGAKGEFLVANPAFLSMFGVDSEEALKGINVVDLYLNPGEREVFSDNLLAQGSVAGVELRLRKGDGTPMWGSVTARVVYGESGEAAYFDCTIEDITGRKQADEELKHRVEQLTALSRASQAVTASLELQQVLDEIVSLAGEVTGSDYTTVAMVDEEGNLLQGAEVEPDVPILVRRARADGYTDWIVRSRQAVILDELADDGTIITPIPEGAPRTANQLMTQAGVKAFAGLPLIARERLLGVLYLHSFRPYQFHDQLPLLSAFANQAAVAIENARLYDEIRRRLDELTTLHEIGQALTSTLDLQKMLTIIAEHTTRLLGVAATSVLLHDEASDDLWFAAASGVESDLVRDMRLAMGQGIAGWVAQHGEPALVPDVAQDRRFFGDFDKETGFSTHSVLCVPLQSKGQTIGAIEAMNKESGPFDREDLRLLSSLAATAAIAIENARLYQEERTRHGTLRTLVDSSPDFIYIKDAGSRYIVSNAAHARFLGVRTPDEVVGKSIFEVYPRELAAQYYADDQRVVGSGQPLLNREEVSVDRAGNMVWLLTTKVPLRDSQGEVVGLVGISRDITERRRVEEELQHRNRELALLNRVISASASGLELEVILETACRELALAFDVPRATAALLNEEKTAAVVVAEYLAEGRPPTLNNIIPIESSPSFQYLLSYKASLTVDDAQNDPRLTAIHDLVRQHGTVSLLLLPLIVEGSVAGSLGLEAIEPRRFSVEEVSLAWSVADQLAAAIQQTRLREQVRRQAAELERKVAERTAELSVANAELAKAARLKDEFLASMSHELRTPLNAVLGLSEALQEQVYGSLNEEQIRSLHIIEESGRHLLDLINDILDVAKIGAGKLELEIGPVSVESVCRAGLELVKPAAHKKQLKVSSVFDSAVTMIQADGRRLKQILANLLSNAVKFTPAGGAIGLEVVGDAEGEKIRFTVWDTGIGIAPEDTERLFQPFVQLDSSLSRQYAGTGLGLTLVYRLTEMHCGSVSLESQVGQGSRFTVSLPWREPVPPVPSGPSRAACPERPVPSGLSRAETRGDEGRREETRGDEGRRGETRGDEGGEVEGPAVRPARAGIESAHRRVLIIEDSPVVAGQLTRYLDELGLETIVHPREENAVGKALAVQPDAIILDILLPDPAGWDVLAQLKAEPRTQGIPVLIVSVVDERARGLALGAADYLVKPISRPQLQQALSQIMPRGVEEQQPPSVAAADQEPETERPLILLAEDNESSIDMVLDYLLARGYRLVVARDGAEALERAREERPDLVLMDIQMPGMDGLEATRHMRADAELADIPIIALTALAMPGDRERCLEAGANDYLSKPVSLKRLVQAIEAQTEES